MRADIKMNVIKSQNKVHMDLLSDVLSPEILHKRVPRLEETAVARQEHKNRMQTIQKLGALGSTGWNENHSLQYVANVDVSIWGAVLSVFAKYDEDGNLMDDGLLYKVNERGDVVLNKDFFYALLSGPLKDHDMRAKISLM